MENVKRLDYMRLFLHVVAYNEHIKYNEFNLSQQKKNHKLSSTVKVSRFPDKFINQLKRLLSFFENVFTAIHSFIKLITFNNMCFSMQLTIK